MKSSLVLECNCINIDPPTVIAWAWLPWTFNVNEWAYVMLIVPVSVSYAGNPNTIMALAGNKADLLEARQVPADVCSCPDIPLLTLSSCITSSLLVVAVTETGTFIISIIDAYFFLY
jgi:hypothetical protein